MSNIGACSVTNRNAKSTLRIAVVSQKFGQIIHSVKEGDPTVVVLVVARDFAWCVVASKFVRLGQIDGFVFFVA